MLKIIPASHQIYRPIMNIVWDESVWAEMQTQSSLQDVMKKEGIAT